MNVYFLKVTHAHRVLLVALHLLLRRGLSICHLILLRGRQRNDVGLWTHRLVLQLVHARFDFALYDIWIINRTARVGSSLSLTRSIAGARGRGHLQRQRVTAAVLLGNGVSHIRRLVHRDPRVLGHVAIEILVGGGWLLALAEGTAWVGAAAADLLRQLYRLL